MNWIRENKFLTAFLVVVVIGVGALAFLTYMSYGKFSLISENYERQAAELKRLQNLAPYPDAANLKKLQDDKEAYQEASMELRTELAKLEFPLESLEPTQFQDRLRAAVSAIQQKATQAGVQLPEKFYAGDEPYQTALPKDSVAATYLGRQLKAIEFVLNDLIDCGPVAIVNVKRIPLPEEGVATKTGGGQPRPQSSKPLVSSHPFEVAFVIEQGRLRKFLNDLDSATKQFFIVRNLRIKNQNDKGPARQEAAPVGVVGGEQQPGAQPPTREYVVGTEKLEVVARIEMIDFNVAPAK